MVALFEVGALTTSMQVILNDEVLYDRDQAFGGAQHTLIVRHMDSPWRLRPRSETVICRRTTSRRFCAPSSIVWLKRS